ncbi:MAG: hypothetical protein HYY54_00635 [candidate division NC10 bacterium]|nr:hypothetical protein [candidate division NC10 bacterium]
MAGFSLLLECSKCNTINYLDPFSFWFFKGKTKCAGCDAVSYIEMDNGQRVKTEPAEGKPDKLPGYAQSKDYKTDYRTPDKVSPPAYARPPDVKHGPTYKNVRGNLVAAGPLNAEDLVGSRPRFILEGRPYK